MLQEIRDKTHGWIAGIIISILILSFALWGIHSYLVGGSVGDVVAKVNGVDIKERDLSLASERLHRQLELRKANDLLATAGSNIKKEALQSLINLQVLKQASLNQNYRISPTQVESYLENMPDFRVNNQFSVARFQQVLNATLFSTNDFLDLIRSTLLIDQPRLGIIFSSFSLPNEVNHSIGLINQERDIEYALLPSSLFLKQPITFSQDKIQAYYNQHIKDFQKPEQVNIEYLLLSRKDLMSKIHPTDSELMKYYNDYKKPETQSFDKVKNEVMTAVIFQQSEEQLANLKEKLANLTYEHPSSLKPAAEALGLPIQVTGLFSKNKGNDEFSNNPKIRDAAFSSDVLNALNNSDVIPMSEDSVVVLRIKSHSPSTSSPLSEVQQQITERLKSADLENRASQLANTIISQLQSGQPSDSVAKQNNLVWVNSGFVTRHSTKVDPAILDVAFDLPNTEKSFVIAKMANGYAIVGLKAVKNGSLMHSEDYDAFADQIQNTQGLLEYQLYTQSLMKKAKIVIEQPTA
jgi:peptidyl-prolyl cis-trans isomerase D